MPGVDGLTPGQLKKFGKSAQRSGDLYTAIFFYERYREYRENNQDINFTLAELHRSARNYEKAAELYNQVKLKAAKKYPLAQFYFAQMLKSMGQYDDAITEFNKFKRSYKGQKDERVYSKLVKIEVEGCDSAKKIIEKPLNLTISNLNNSINGPHIELSPVPVNDSLFIYASLRIDSLVYFNENNVDTAKPVRQFYQALKPEMTGLGEHPGTLR
ncbi:MAG: tetratricopeptide repeat protein [Bacteroidales bacterium]|nr:tetratricopeptide repeat protein [Bacteroidales bacterium]